MNSRYQRNRIYISDKEQEAIKNMPILIAGIGIGSIIAECALRLGFETITIIDGDIVEESNLNRQNYIYNDIDRPKVYALRNRLQEINPHAKIKYYNQYLNFDNVNDIIAGHSIAINALDFTTDLPLVFDDICQKNNIHILHPYNLGWAGAVAIISPKGENLRSLTEQNSKASEIDFVKHILNNSNTQQIKWLKDVLDEYMNDYPTISPPQISVGTWLLSGLCTALMIRITNQEHIKAFPEFYLKDVF